MDKRVTAYKHMQRLSEVYRKHAEAAEALIRIDEELLLRTDAAAAEAGACQKAIDAVLQEKSRGAAADAQRIAENMAVIQGHASSRAAFEAAAQQLRMEAEAWRTVMQMYDAEAKDIEKTLRDMGVPLA